MHVYIYDSFLSQKKYESILSRIETRLTDLGLNGKICRQGATKNFKDTIQNEILRGAKTIIAIGNDETLNEVVSGMMLNNTPVGLIPVNSGLNYFANAFGIPFNEKACDILAARRVEQIDLGLANNEIFLSTASISTEGTIIEINNNYSVEIYEKGLINIINLSINQLELPENFAFNPSDGLLEIVISTEDKKYFKKINTIESVFTLKQFFLHNTKNNFITLDNYKKIKTPIEFNILPKKLNLIVGKNRKY